MNESNEIKLAAFYGRLPTDQQEVSLETQEAKARIESRVAASEGKRYPGLFVASENPLMD